MKLGEAFNYMKKIINNGVKKGYSVDEVKNSIDSYIDILVEDGDLTMEKAEILRAVSNELSSIMSNEKTADEVIIDVLDEKEDEKARVSEVSEPFVYACSRPVMVERCSSSSSSVRSCGGSRTTVSSSCGSSSTSSYCGGGRGGYSRC